MQSPPVKGFFFLSPGTDILCLVFNTKQNTVSLLILGNEDFGRMKLSISSVWLWSALDMLSHRKAEEELTSVPLESQHYQWVLSQVQSAQSEELRNRGLTITTAPALANGLYSFRNATGFKRCCKTQLSSSPSLLISPQSWEKSTLFSSLWSNFNS